MSVGLSSSLCLAWRGGTLQFENPKPFRNLNVSRGACERFEKAKPSDDVWRLNEWVAVKVGI
jgi:hypothetical protein